MTPGGSASHCRHPSTSWASQSVSAALIQPTWSQPELGKGGRAGLCVSVRAGRATRRMCQPSGPSRVSVRKRGQNTPVFLAVALAGAKAESWDVMGVPGVGGGEGYSGSQGQSRLWMPGRAPGSGLTRPRGHCRDGPRPRLTPAALQASTSTSQLESTGTWSFGPTRPSPAMTTRALWTWSSR